MKVALVHSQGSDAPQTGPGTYAGMLAAGIAGHGIQPRWLSDLPRTGDYDAVHVLDMKQLVRGSLTPPPEPYPFPLILNLHDDYWTGVRKYPAVDGALRAWRRRRWGPRYRSWIQRADHVIVHSPTVESAVAHGRVTTVPLPMSPPSVLHPNPGESFRWLFGGRDSLRKGLPVLGRALRLSPGGERLVVVGEDFPHLKFLQSRWLRGVHARRLGGVSAAGMEEVWAEVHAVVLPSYDEAFGLVPLEAVLRGIPVVVSDVGGLGRWVREAKAGALAPPGDHRGLYEAMTEVRRNYETWKQAALKAREALIPRHDPARVWSLCLNVYAKARSRPR